MRALVYHGKGDVQVEVVEAGRGVKNLTIGDRVVVPLLQDFVWLKNSEVQK